MKQGGIRDDSGTPPSSVTFGQRPTVVLQSGRTLGIMVGELGPSVEAATAPYQYALSTRAGSECIAHVIQGLTELNSEATVLSIDGISAYDQISRAAMGGLFSVEVRPSHS